MSVGVNTAVNECDPAVGANDPDVASPDPLTATGEPTFVTPSLNWIDPAGCADAPDDDAVADNVIDVPTLIPDATDGDGAVTDVSVFGTTV